MQCTCGGMIILSQHEVKTPKGADTWAKGKWSKLPLQIDQHTCRDCGRHAYQAFEGKTCVARRGL